MGGGDVLDSLGFHTKIESLGLNTEKKNDCKDPGTWARSLRVERTLNSEG